MNRKLVIIFSSLYVLFMATLAIYYHINDKPYKSLVAIGGIICGAIPLLLALFTKKLQFNLPIVISYLVFLFGSQYLGTIMQWYGLGWWDTFIHFISGGILAFTGIALYERLTHTKTANEISPWFIFIFTLSFATLGGVLWEIYEFSFGYFFNVVLQADNTDTMTDLIADTLGGLIIAVWAGFRTKRRLNTAKKNVETHRYE